MILGDLLRGRPPDGNVTVRRHPAQKVLREVSPMRHDHLLGEEHDEQTPTPKIGVQALEAKAHEKESLLQRGGEMMEEERGPSLIERIRALWLKVGITQKEGQKLQEVLRDPMPPVDSHLRLSLGGRSREQRDREKRRRK